MRYVLVSVFRTGSTGFMEGCEAGELPVLVETDPDDPMTPIRQRLKECSPKMFGSWGFPLNYPDEVALKLLRPGTSPTLAMTSVGLAVAPPGGGYRVAFLWRHPWEIRKAYENDFDWSFRFDDTGREKVTAHMTVPWLTRNVGRGRYGYEAAFQRLCDHVANRRDVHSVHEFQYRAGYRGDLPSLEHDALDIYRELAAQGWPLDPDLAAAAVDVERYCNWKAEDIPEATGVPVG